MFAALGQVSFEVIGSPTGFQTTAEYHYGEIKLAAGRPTLQWIAENLARVRLEIALHQIYAQPDADFQALIDTAQAHQPVPLVLGNGVFRGNFVIERITREETWMSDQGDAIALRATLELLEWAGTLPQGAAQSQPRAVIGVAGSPGLGAIGAFGGGALPIPTLNYLSVPIAALIRRAV